MGEESYALSVCIFLRLLGLVYLAAFVSLGVQILGLVGRDGILPASELLAAGPGGRLERWLRMPTLCHWRADDGFLRLLCLAGALLSVALAAGVAWPPILFALWLLYLSLFTVSRLFLGYQWDVLLLEAGFLAVFLSFAPSSDVLRWLLWWLWFRLLFSSGFVKIRSGDPTWRGFTALAFHHETQPLPTWLAWYAHRLPLWFHKLSAGATFAIELAVPWLVFFPAPARHFAGAVTIGFMVLVLLTGNYGFFNWLTIALTILLFEDRVLASLLPGPAGIENGDRELPVAVALPLVSLVLLLSLWVLSRQSGWTFRWPRAFLRLFDALQPFCLVNAYGLFAVMTTSRPEIIVEGSRDGESWQAYEFIYKPGELTRGPCFVAPHQPRLDWQMWFAALGGLTSSPWFLRFCFCLLRGSPSVLKLLARDPFAGAPPRYVRAWLYDYRFSDRAERRSTRRWWERELIGPYCPPLASSGAPGPGRYNAHLEGG